VSREHKHVAAVFLVADRYGVQLPERITDLRRRLDTLNATTVEPTGASPDEIRERMLRDLRDGQVADGLDAGDLLIAEEEKRAAEITGRLLVQAREQVAIELATAVRDAADEISASLDDAVKSLWQEFAEAAAKIADLDGRSVDAMARASGAQRKAWARSRELATAYAELRRAWSGVHDPRAVRLDGAGEFAEIEQGLGTVWERWKVSPMSPAPVPPWDPSDTHDMLRHVAAAGASVHCPTPEQRDRLWSEAHADQLAAVEAQRQRHHQVRGSAHRPGDEETRLYGLGRKPRDLTAGMVNQSTARDDPSTEYGPARASEVPPGFGAGDGPDDAD
jgi:hypothetical protein